MESLTKLQKSDKVYNEDGEISLLKTVKNPIRALEYLISGIKNQTNREDFNLIFDDRIYFYDKTLNGSSSICGLQEIAEKNLTYENVNKVSLCITNKINSRALSSILHFNEIELYNFVIALDSARCSYMQDIYTFFNYQINSKLSAEKIWEEKNYRYWRDNSCDLEEEIYTLKSAIGTIRRENPNWV